MVNYRLSYPNRLVDIEANNMVEAYRLGVERFGTEPTTIEEANDDL